MQCVRGQTPPCSLITVFCRKVTSFVRRSLPGGDGPAFQLCGVQTTLTRAGMRHIPPRSPDLWQESEVRPLAGDWMLLW